MKQYTIKVTEGNAFQLLLRMMSRYYESSQPIDEAIDYTTLKNVVVTVGGVEWSDYTLTADGVLVDIPATMKLGTYNVTVTASYQMISIRAAYYECFAIVPWSYQANAVNYIPTSPIASEIAYIIGITGDAELEELKEGYRQKTADAEAAETAAEAAKENFDSKAESLTDTIASQQRTIENLSEGGGGGGGDTQQILDAIGAQTTEIKGSDADATNSAIKALVRLIRTIVNDVDVHVDDIFNWITGAGPENLSPMADKQDVQSVLNAILATSANVSGAASGLQGTDNTATLTAIQQLIGYTINEIDNV